jgi:hypothetical protein
LPSGDVPQQTSYGPIPIFGDQFPNSGTTLSGVVPVEIRADAAPTLLWTGHIDAITAVALAVDGTPVSMQTLAGPTTKTDQTLQWDTSKISNGTHKLTAIAYGIDGGALSTDANLLFTADFPQDMSRSVRISNSGASQATATPTRTPIPSTPTPTTTPVPNQPTPTATPPSGNPGTSGKLGLSSKGGVLDTDDANSMTGSRITVGTRAETVSSMSAFVGPADNAPHNQFSFAIYTDVNSAPGSLVAQSANGVLTANAWNSLPIRATLNANTSYWLVYNNNASSGGMNDVYYNNVANQVGAFAAHAFGNWPATFGADNVGTYQVSIYATVTP